MSNYSNHVDGFYTTLQFVQLSDPVTGSYTTIPAPIPEPEPGPGGIIEFYSYGPVTVFTSSRCVNTLGGY